MAVEVVVRGQNQSGGPLKQAADDVRGVGTAGTESAGKLDGFFSVLRTGLAAGAIAGIVGVGSALVDVSGKAAIAQNTLQGLDGVDMGGVLDTANLLSARYGVDLQESVAATRTLMSEFGLTSQQANDLMVAGFERGLNTSGDFLDSIGEYSNLFAENGANADQFFSLLETGMAGGALGTDKAADAFKEFGIRITDGSKASAEALAALGLDQLTADLTSGAITATDAFGIVQGALAGVQDPLLQAQLGVALFGTQFEDLGASAVLNIDLAATSMEELGATAEAGRTRFASLGEIWPILWGQFTNLLLPANTALLDFVNQTANGQGAVAGLLSQLQPVGAFFVANWQPAVAAAAAILAVVFAGAIGAAVTALAGVVVAAAPVIAILGVAGAAGAALYSLWQSNFGGIQEATQAAMTAVQSVITSVLGVVQTFWQQNGSQIMTFTRQTWTQIQSIIGTIAQIVATLVRTVFGGIASFITTHGSTIQTVLSAVWNSIRTTIQTVLGVIQGITTTVLGVLQGDWGKAASGIRQIVDSLVSGVRGQFDNLRTVIQNLGPGMLNAALSIGRSIVDGVAQGISRGASAIADAARNAAKAALDAAKSFLGISSPSKVFAEEVAGESIAGWVQRLQSGRSEVAAAATDVARASVSASRDVTRSSQISVGGIVINQRNGERGDQVADLAVRKLQQSLSLRG